MSECAFECVSVCVSEKECEREFTTACALFTDLVVYDARTHSQQKVWHIASLCDKLVSSRSNYLAEFVRVWCSHVLQRKLRTQRDVEDEN